MFLSQTALPQSNHIIRPKHLSRLKNLKDHKWLKNLHNNESYNKLASPAKRKRRMVGGSNRNDTNLEAHTKNERYNNDVNGYIRYIHLRNGRIDTPLTFLRKCTCAHNYKRRLHDASRLLWSAELAKEAQNRADELASMGIFTESDIRMRNKDENIYVDNIVDLSSSCSRAVESWYAESKSYNYTQNDISDDTGLSRHFSIYRNKNFPQDVCA